MKKFLSLFVILMFTLVLSACGKTTGTNGTNATTTVAKPNAKIVTLAHWSIGTVEDNRLVRRQITKFNETHDDIQIEIVEQVGNNWEEFLAAKAVAGEFPDVVMVGEVPKYVIKDYIGDIKSIVSADPEWNDIPVALRESITYGDKVFAIPAAYHYAGYFANLDLIENASVDTIFDNFDYTLDEFFDAITKVRDTSKDGGKSTIGLDNPMEFINWLPSVYDETGKIKHFAWNGENFDFNGPAIKAALAKAAELYDNGLTFASYSDQKTGTTEAPIPSEREILFGQTGEIETFKAGKMGFKWEVTWSSSGLETDIANRFDYDFVGLPGGKVIGIADYYGISKSAKDKAAAYEVVKYLTFGSQGINDTFKIIEDAAKEDVILTMNGLPINETQSIIDKWFDSFPQPGIKKAYELAAKGEVTILIEGNKYIPGFGNARWGYDTGIDKQISRPNEPKGSTISIGDLIWDAAQGKISYEDHMTAQVADAINLEFLKAQLEIVQK